jgi:predicted small lipoprotein YifL
MKMTKMIKMLALTLALILVLSLAACGGKSAPPETPPANPAPVVTEEPASDYEQFLSEYEAWVDDYVAFMQKYNDNPSDPDLLTDYAALLTEMTEWSDKADKIQGELTGDDLTAYTETMTRILKKLTDALESEKPVEEEPATTPEKPVAEKPATGDSVNFQQFLKEYETWVDGYVAFMKKYSANPADPTLLTDYTKWLTEMTEWTEKVDKIEDDLTGDDLTAYLETLTRITKKLSEV